MRTGYEDVYAPGICIKKSVYVSFEQDFIKCVSKTSCYDGVVSFCFDRG